MLATLSGSSLTQAAPCASDVVASYTASGFTCEVGNLHFSNFFANGSFFGSNSNRTASYPSEIVITPVATASGGGFTLSNMNLSFTGGFSSTSGWLVFDVAALTGLITDASVELGNYTISGDGYVSAGLSDYDGLIFGTSAFDYGSFVLSSASASFPGVSGFRTFASATAGVGSFSGGAGFIDGYTMLLSISENAIPEPGSALLLFSGLFALVARRKFIDGATPLEPRYV